MTEMGLEYEMKFRGTPENQLRLRQEIAGEETEYSMETTYYDTPGGAMSARHYTLRCRQENDKSVCTLKTPAQDGGRQEYELECPDIQSAIPMLCKLSDIKELPHLLSEGVVPICGARFTRIAKNVILPDCVVELALDRGILTGGGREVPLCEVEVELKQGSKEGAFAYALALAAKYGLEPEPLSKFRRAQLLAKGEEETL